MTARIGELAALGTAISWTIGALVMEQAVKRVGVMAVNTLKVAFGTLYLALLAYVLNGSFIPTNISGSAWIFLSASGVVGFVIGDYFLLHAYALVGSSLTMLLMSLSVPFTAIGAFFIFKEKLSYWSLAGILVCITGIALTVSAGWKKQKNEISPEKTDDVQSQTLKRRYHIGVVFSILSALCMAVGTLFTKAGAAGINSVSATQIRIISALVGFLLFALFTGKVGEIKKSVHDRKGFSLIAVGGLFGPFIGVGLLIFALQNAKAGIVSTLSSLTPVLIIPPSIIFFKRLILPVEILGACCAVAGLAMLFL
ncbi:MAG TPA: DMT family transporter [Treponemataceae bacterium]|nr:DMT family transporter [Treponemataceae bacterium]